MPAAPWSFSLQGPRSTKTLKSSRIYKTSSYQASPGSLTNQRYIALQNDYLIFRQFVSRSFPNNYSILLRVQGSHETSMRHVMFKS